MTKKSHVAVLKTNPKDCTSDFEKCMDLVNFNKILNPKISTLLKINITWGEYFPSCSTSPWQLDGVLNKLKKEGFSNIHPVENITVVTDPYKGMENNKLNNVLLKYGFTFECLADMEWSEYEIEKKFVFGREDLMLPEILRGSQVIHLPTIKCHGHSTMTCSMKNAFGFLKEVRHHYHSNIHEILVDLLRIQKTYCKSLFSIVDGTISMDGAGPRTGVPKIENIIVAGGDLVSVDAVVAKMMGFDPMSIRYIKLADEEGLGIGRLEDIKIIGEDIENINFRFKTKYDPVIYFDRFFRATSLEPLIFRTSLFNLIIVLSDKYRYLWLKTVGNRHIKRIMKTEWGDLFNSY